MFLFQESQRFGSLGGKFRALLSPRGLVNLLSKFFKKEDGKFRL